MLCKLNRRVGVIVVGFRQTTELRKCKRDGCSVMVRASARTYCCKECKVVSKASKKAAKTVATNCCVCGATVVRVVYAKSRRSFCCSLECQRRWSMVLNHSKAGDFNPAKKSAKAKKLYYQKRSALRRAKWLSGWGLEIKNRLSKSTSTPPTDAWLKAIGGRIRAGRGRDVVSRQIKNPSGSIQKALERVVLKRLWFSKPDWEKKIGNKLSSMKSRRRRKKNAKRIKDCGDHEETRRVWVQVCFNWVGD